VTLAEHNSLRFLTLTSWWCLLQPRCCCSSRPTGRPVAVTGRNAATTTEKYVPSSVYDCAQVSRVMRWFVRGRCDTGTEFSSVMSTLYYCLHRAYNECNPQFYAIRRPTPDSKSQKIILVFAYNCAFVCVYIFCLKNIKLIIEEINKINRYLFSSAGIVHIRFKITIITIKNR